MIIRLSDLELDKLILISYGEELIEVLRGIHPDRALQSSTIQLLMHKGYSTNSEKVHQYLIDVFSNNRIKFIENAIDWIDKNSTLEHTIFPIVKINDLCMNKPSDFIEKSIYELGLTFINYLLDVIEDSGFFVKLCFIKCVCLLLYFNYRTMNSLFVDKVIIRLVDICIDNYKEPLIRFEVCRILSISDLEESLKLLKYMQKHDDIYAIKFVSILSIDEINRRCKDISDSSELKNRILGLN